MAKKRKKLKFAKVQAAKKDLTAYCNSTAPELPGTVQVLRDKVLAANHIVDEKTWLVKLLTQRPIGRLDFRNPDVQRSYYLRGAAEILSIAGILHRRPRLVRDDKIKLLTDLYTIGIDMRHAIKRYEQLRKDAENCEMARTSEFVF